MQRVYCVVVLPVFLLEISCTYTSVDFVSSELAVLASRYARVTCSLLKAKPVWEAAL